MSSAFRWRNRFLAFAPLFIWIAVIFYLSTDQGSMSRTSLFVRPLLEFFFPTANEATLQIYHGYVRKAAHLTEYAILGGLAIRAFYSTFQSQTFTYLVAILIVAAVAIADEVGQSFRPTRTGSVTDVLIDIAGGTTLIGLVWLIARLRRTDSVV